MSAQRTWGGRFESGMDQLTAEYTAGMDQDFWAHDIAGSVAHARMLGRQGIIPAADADAIVGGLGLVLEDFREGRVTWRPELEDIHTHVEVLLREKIGTPAGRLHTARSRNDQVALMNRMVVREACDIAIEATAELVSVLCDLGEKHAADPMPGYTHVQRAQPITLGHHLLAYGEMLLRDREMVAQELGFEGVSRNSLDATADRDFVAEFASACALTQVHLSRFAEDIVLWASAEYGFVTLPDGFATGSSIMPQKKNADVAELARGRSGRAIAELVGILTTMKGLPMAYDRDLQEDKSYIIGASNVVLPTLRIFAAMVPALRFNLDRMRLAAGQGYALATDIADYLVKKGLPFREAHEVVGGLVREAEERRCELHELPMDFYGAASPLFAADVLELTVESALAARDIPGGTAPRQARMAAAALRAALG
jgi:argininosuccinate lyase